MKKGLLIFGTVAVFSIGLHFTGRTSSSQPPAGHTGAPGEAHCATSGCHTGSLNTGGGSVTLVNPPAIYIPGTTYNLQVQVTDPARTRFGFELVALQAGNLQAGTITLINSNNTALQTLGGKTYISHRNASTTNIWNFNWQAPATNVGPVTFYLAGNAANNNNNTTGDNIYTSSRVMNPSASTGIKENAAAQFSVFPNPASDRLHLNVPEKPQSVKIFDAAGKEIFNGQELTDQNQLDVSKYPNGTYFLQIEQQKAQALKRFVVQH